MRNVRTKSFKELFERLPIRIQEHAIEVFRQFKRDPAHPSLRRHELKPSKSGRHRANGYSVAVGLSYRAIYTVEENTNVWYWIGSHEDYNNFVGSK